MTNNGICSLINIGCSTAENTITLKSTFREIFNILRSGYLPVVTLETGEDASLALILYARVEEPNATVHVFIEGELMMIDADTSPDNYPVITFE